MDIIGMSGFKYLRDSVNVRDVLSDMAGGTITVLTEECYDEALVGIIEKYGIEPCVVYDKGKLLEIIMRENNCDIFEALEHFEYNIIGAYVGETTPAFLSTLESGGNLWMKSNTFVARSVESFKRMIKAIIFAKPVWSMIKRLQRRRLNRLVQNAEKQASE